MSRIKVEMYLDLDDEALAASGEDRPPPSDIDDWYDSDVFTAAELGIVEPTHEELVSIEKVDG